jgi:hypothetical protein
MPTPARSMYLSERYRLLRNTLATLRFAHCRKEQVFSRGHRSCEHHPEIVTKLCSILASLQLLW